MLIADPSSTCDICFENFSSSRECWCIPCGEHLAGYTHHSGSDASFPVFRQVTFFVVNVYAASLSSHAPFVVHH